MVDSPDDVCLIPQESSENMKSPVIMTEYWHAAVSRVTAHVKTSLEGHLESLGVPRVTRVFFRVIESQTDEGQRNPTDNEFCMCVMHNTQSRPWNDFGCCN